MRPRSSLAGMLVLVAITALVCATISLAVDLRARPVVALTAASLATATLGAVLRRGPLRAFCAGFALIGWGYFLAAFVSPQVRYSLPTTRPLLHLHEAAFGSPTIASPNDVAPLVLWLYEYLRVAHAMTALALGLLGGMVTVLVMLAVRMARRRRPQALAAGPP